MRWRGYRWGGYRWDKGGQRGLPPNIHLCLIEAHSMRGIEKYKPRAFIRIFTVFISKLL